MWAALIVENPTPQSMNTPSKAARSAGARYAIRLGGAVPARVAEAMGIGISPR